MFLDFCCLDQYGCDDIVYEVNFFGIFDGLVDGVFNIVIVFVWGKKQGISEESDL